MVCSKVSSPCAVDVASGRLGLREPKVGEILWANADAEFAGAIRFDTDRTRSRPRRRLAMNDSPRGRSEEGSTKRIGSREDSAENEAARRPGGHRAVGHARQDRPDNARDGSWGAAYGQALNTWIAKVEDNPRLPGEAGIEAICSERSRCSGSTAPRPRRRSSMASRQC